MPTKIIYAGTDISDMVNIKSCVIRDHAGGRADSVDLSMADGKGLWRKWAPKRGDTLQVITDHFDTGKMYLDNPGLIPGSFSLEAISVPLSMKKQKNRIWRDVRLSEVIRDIATGCGMPVSSFGVQERSYKCVTQINETDISFLNRVLSREGYAEKITGGGIVVFDERSMEKTAPKVTITPADVYPSYCFESGYELVESLSVVHAPAFGAKITGTARDGTIIGGFRRVVEYVSDQAEAVRFANGYLRARNKEKVTGYLPLQYITQIAAGSTLAVKGFGMYDGDYFVACVEYDTVRQITTAVIRKPLDY